jgi:multidrug efflux system membrane fusion protein
MARRHRWVLALMAAGVLAAGVYAALTVASHGWPRTGRPESPPVSAAVPVVAAPARARDVAVYLTGLGSVMPLKTVTIHTRVDGQLMSVKFEEGQLVQRGDLLAEIDPRPFEVQLAQAQGQLLRDQALLDNARLDLERYKVLVEQDSIPRQQLDTQKSLVRQYEGTVKADQAQVDSARLQLVYCHVTSPITGRAGLRLVDPGNIVHAADATGLVVITQLQPIGVVFTLPEDDIPSVLDKLRPGVRLPVEAYDRDQRRKLTTGSLLTIDNQVDPATGTVRLKAVFPNADNRLFPSQFVNARLVLDVKRGATVVPAAAIQRTDRGPSLYVVEPDETVDVRQVTVGAADGDDVAIDAGLAVGELVVVDGPDQLGEGSRVSIQARRVS